MWTHARWMKMDLETKDRKIFQQTLRRVCRGTRKEKKTSTKEGRGIKLQCKYLQFKKQRNPERKTRSSTKVFRHSFTRCKHQFRAPACPTRQSDDPVRVYHNTFSFSSDHFPASSTHVTISFHHTKNFTRSLSHWVAVRTHHLCTQLIIKSPPNKTFDLLLIRLTSRTVKSNINQR